MGGSPTNGIAVGWGARDGVSSQCVVDGVSKPAFYLAWAERVAVVACIARDCRGGKTAAGFAVDSGFDVSYLDCHAHGCEGNGFHPAGEDAPSWAGAGARGLQSGDPALRSPRRRIHHARSGENTAHPTRPSSPLRAVSKAMGPASVSCC